MTTFDAEIVRSYGTASFDGSGSTTVDIYDDDIVCVVVQKETTYGYVTVELWDHFEQEGGIFGGERDEYNLASSATTRADYGVVSVCNR